MEEKRGGAGKREWKGNRCGRRAAGGETEGGRE